MNATIPGPNHCRASNLRAVTEPAKPFTLRHAFDREAFPKLDESCFDAAALPKLSFCRQRESD
jgi:hypothetical protein